MFPEYHNESQASITYDYSRGELFEMGHRILQEVN